MKTTSVSTAKERLNALKGVGLSKEEKVNEPKKRTSFRDYEVGFWNAIRSGNVSDSLSEGTRGGGFLVPDSFDEQLITALTEKSVMRKLATIIKTEHNRDFIIEESIGDCDWVVEGARIPDDDFNFSQIRLMAHKLAARVIVSNELLEDIPHNIESHLTQLFTMKISKAEEDAFINGNGIHKPTGILNTAEVGLISENSGTFTADDIIDLYYSVRQRYREKKESVWLMSTNAINILAKLKDATGRYLWRTTELSNGEKLLLGHSVIESKYMPGVEVSSKPVLFGDFSNYRIGDRGNRILKQLDEIYADHDQTAFIITERVDGILALPETVKSLQIKA